MTADCTTSFNLTQMRRFSRNFHRQCSFREVTIRNESFLVLLTIFSDPKVVVKDSYITYTIILEPSRFRSLVVFNYFFSFWCSKFAVNPIKYKNKKLKMINKSFLLILTLTLP